MHRFLTAVTFGVCILLLAGPSSSFAGRPSVTPAIVIDGQFDIFDLTLAILHAEKVWGQTIPFEQRLLLAEIANVESHFGRVLRHPRSGATGPLQFMPATVDFLLNRWEMGAKYLPLLTAAWEVYRDDWTLEKNLRENLSFNIFLFLLYFHKNNGNEYSLQKINGRRSFYTTIWNPKLPRGAYEYALYIKRADEIKEWYDVLNSIRHTCLEETINARMAMND